MSDQNQSAPIRPESEEDLESAILLLQSPFGGGPHEREHLQAAQYLLDHASRSHPRLLALLQSGEAANPYALIEILPQFGRPESIPVLEDLMTRGPQNLAQAAAQALAVHQLDGARDALLRGLRHTVSETVIAAADALTARGDSSVCSELKKILSHTDSSVRYHVIQAAWSLDCLKPETLSAIAGNDPNEDIRELAERLVKTRHNRGAKH